MMVWVGCIAAIAAGIYCILASYALLLARAAGWTSWAENLLGIVLVGVGIFFVWLGISELPVTVSIRSDQ
jgi:threonine/homoserine/homoserine lactone efflux protein